MNPEHGSTRIGDTTATPVPTGTTGTTAGYDVTNRMTGTHADHGEHRSGEHRLGVHKTSAAAAFALVFGLAALFCALTAILAPAAVVLGVTGVILGIAGLKMAKRPGITGRGVATGGLVTALLGLLLGGAVLAGAAVLVNDERRLDQLQGWIDDRRADLPSSGEVRDAVTPE